MSVALASRIARQLIFGGETIRQKVDFGLRSPQQEVDVWLEGLGNPLDVTHRHLMACAAPLIFGIALDAEHSAGAKSAARMALRFIEHGETGQLLGEIWLRFVSSVPAGARELCLFEVAGYRNCCLPRLRLWAHYLQYARARRKAGDRDRDVPISALEARAMIVFYLCPRPTVLVTADGGNVRNMFPMNLMGPAGDGYFAFGLTAPLVDRLRRVVLSTVPPEQAPVISRLGGNHRKSSIEWDQLPFKTVKPRTVEGPVASFARTVREMQVEEIRPLGSHMLFVARVTAEERLSQGLELFSAHGIYLRRKRKL